MNTEGRETHYPFYPRTSAGTKDAKVFPENDLQAYRIVSEGSRNRG